MARARPADDRLPKIFLFGRPSRVKRTAVRPCLWWEDVIKKDLQEIETSWEEVKKEALHRLRWSRSVHSCVGFMWLDAAVSC